NLQVRREFAHLLTKAAQGLFVDELSESLVPQRHDGVYAAALDRARLAPASGNFNMKLAVTVLPRLPQAQARQEQAVEALNGNRQLIDHVQRLALQVDTGSGGLIRRAVDPRSQVNIVF